MSRAIFISVAALTILSGCRGDYGLRCEDTERYAGSAELPPVRVPDDLSVPDEAQALRIPQVAQSSPIDQERAGQGACLESPPDYSEAVNGAEAPPASP